MHVIARLAIAAIPLALVAGRATAQSDTRSLPVELGIDGGASFGLDDPKITTISLPVQRFRVGFPVTPAITIEPSAALNYVRFSSDASDASASQTSFTGDVSALFHFSPDRTRSQLYLRPFVGLSRVSFDSNVEDGDSMTRAHVGGALGIKAPFATRLATRLEGGVLYTPKKDDFESETAITLSVGLSFYTK